MDTIERIQCEPCIDDCKKCYNSYQCVVCENSYFIDDELKCISYNELNNCTSKTPSGCTECEEGFFIEDKYCVKCSNRTDNCNKCDYNGECSRCEEDYILKGSKCIYYKDIDHCTKEEDNKCTKCSFWHEPDDKGTGCDSHVVWWFIVIIALLIFIILLIVIIFAFRIVISILNRLKEKKVREEYSVFDMKYTNIKFATLGDGTIVTNKKEILFEEDEKETIEVDKENRQLICIGNKSSRKLKVQFSTKTRSDKYEIRTNPEVFTIPKGKALEFEVFLRPLCTCSIKDKIMLTTLDMKTAKENHYEIGIKAKTELSTRLDPDELIEEKKLGEGSFGIVYKGTFRSNIVAIKKMKDAFHNEEKMEEFTKEVSMLDKFRCDYIVHFYGAVFIPSKICMVTEFAQYGSLSNLFYKRKNEPIRDKMRIKILLDAARGIEYLHTNGILHRDIKPDNILVFDIEHNEGVVNGKLTDFGSARNINLLMTNMTFSKGVGTPVFMAPEVLKHEHYKAPADIYSFAITMYETMKWGDSYPVSDPRFKFSWNVADFVMSGKRLERLECMNENVYELITQCWQEGPKERLTIDEIVKQLEVLL